MTGVGPRRRKRMRGNVEELPSGSLRVSVYAGIDPVSKQRHYLREVVPAGPSAAAQAEKVARRLAGQVDERRHPRTKATVDQLLDKHFELATLERSTIATYQGYADKHIRPLIGSVQGRIARRRPVRLVLRRASALPGALRPEDVRRAPDRWHACVRRALPPAHLHAAGRVDDSADPLHPQRGAEAGGPLALALDEPDRAGRAAGGPQAEPAATVGAGGGADPLRSVVRPRLGHARLARDGDRCPPR